MDIFCGIYLLQRRMFRLDTPFGSDIIFVCSYIPPIWINVGSGIYLSQSLFSSDTFKD